MAGIYFVLSLDLLLCIFFTYFMFQIQMLYQTILWMNLELMTWFPIWKGLVQRKGEDLKIEFDIILFYKYSFWNVLSIFVMLFWFLVRLKQPSSDPVDSMFKFYYLCIHEAEL